MGTTPLAALPYPEALDDPNVPGDIQAALLAAEKKLVLSFANAAARDAAITAPTAGMLVYLSTPKWWTMHDGTAWVVVGALDRIGCSLARSTAQSIASGSFQAVTWPTETADTDGFYTPTGSTITIPAGCDGLYSITAQADLASTTPMAVRIAAGGIEFDQAAGSLSDKQSHSVTLPLAATNTVVVSVWQQSGGAINLDSARLFVYRVGP